VRIDSNMPNLLPNVAFRTPEGKTVLIVLNESKNLSTFNVLCGGKSIAVSLTGETVGTLVW